MTRDSVAVTHRRAPPLKSAARYESNVCPTIVGVNTQRKGYKKRMRDAPGVGNRVRVV